MNGFSKPGAHGVPHFTRTSLLGLSKHDLERDSGFSGLINPHCLKVTGLIVFVSDIINWHNFVQYQKCITSKYMHSL